MEATIYVIPGSHPSRTGLLMLEHKGIPHRPVVFPPGFHAAAVRLLGFPGQTVPAVKIGGRRVQGTRRIARALDELQPEPRLLPADPELLEAVEEAERFGDEELQPAARRLATAAVMRGGLSALHEQGDEGRLGKLLTARPGARRRILRLVAWRFGVDRAVEARDRERLLGWLDRVDRWIGEGVLGGPALNAADFQIVTSLALIDYVVELRPLLRSRPAGALMDRVLPGERGL